MKKHAVYRIVHIAVLLLVIALLSAAVFACSVPRKTAVGHSYTLASASQYVPRDDDGDVKDIRVDVIASTRDEGSQAQRIARSIEKSGIRATYRAAKNAQQQREQVRNAVNSYARLIVIPQDAFTQHSNTLWESELSYARSKGMPVIINASANMQLKDFNIPSQYWAAYWDVRASQSEANTSIFEAVMCVVEDRPHNSTLLTHISAQEE